MVLDELTSEQDFAGTLYAGPNGKVLTGILRRSGLGREACTFSCVKACLGSSPQIEIPRNVATIIAFGDESLRLLTGKTGIQSKRGQYFELRKEFKRDDVRVYPTYPLGLVRRVPTYRNIVVADIQRALSANKESEDIKWEWWDGQELPDSEVHS